MSGGGGDPPLLQLLPKPASNSSHPKPPKAPSDHQKPQKIKKYRPRKAETNVNLTEEEKNHLAAKARSYNWESWSPRRTPSVATIPCIPHVLCAMHRELLKSKALPMDDIYSQLPCTIVGKKRVNMSVEKGYLLFGKRYLSSKNPIKTKRKFVSEELKDKCRWRNKGAWEKVAGLNGSVVGIHFHMDLEFLVGNLKVPTEWTADEYLSVTSEAGESSLVVLRCKNPIWNSCEAQVEEAEALLLGFYQKLVNEHEGADVDEIKSLVFDTEVQLGSAITRFENMRDEFKASQEMTTGVQSVAADDSINLELSLALPGANSCSGDVSVVTPGAYFVALNHKTVEDKNLKTILKQNQKGCSSAADGNSGILVVADHLVAADHLVPDHLVAADHLVPDHLVPDCDVSDYTSRNLVLKRDQTQRSAKGKEKMHE